MSDNELLSATVRAARDERRATAELLTLLAEIDARRLYLGQGYSSLFAYCTQVLHLSDHAAYHRIEAARAARQHPVILELVAAGDVTLTTVAMLRPHLTAENHADLLAAARHKSKRDVEHQVACLAPKPDARTLIRRLPTKMPATIDLLTQADDRTPGGRVIVSQDERVGTSLVPPLTAAQASPVPAIPRPTVAPLASDRYLLRVTLSTETHAKLRRAQALMRHTIPDGDPASVLDRALTLLVDQLEKAKSARTSRPRQASSQRVAPSPSSRYIPAAVRRAVWVRDEGRCAFVGPHGRCTETGCLEFHHVIPFARGGPTEVGNLALRCRAHNSFESELFFGRWEPSTRGDASVDA